MGPPIDETKCAKEQDNETKHKTIHFNTLNEIISHKESKI